ncbi:hypothetical protein RRG08_005734 [Elysia crispata]|uniref:Uncharacterized protein n=1 Tax=Elysia crispata TaxID=231223 RepID=A0AAE0YDQ6_9GAST|nr:hypothetical protein RRG08_005734 [Elysia crispata]
MLLHTCNLRERPLSPRPVINGLVQGFIVVAFCKAVMRQPHPLTVLNGCSGYPRSPLSAVRKGGYNGMADPAAALSLHFRSRCRFELFIAYFLIPSIKWRKGQSWSAALASRVKHLKTYLDVTSWPDLATKFSNYRNTELECSNM